MLLSHNITYPSLLQWACCFAWQGETSHSAVVRQDGFRRLCWGPAVSHGSWRAAKNPPGPPHSGRLGYEQKPCSAFSASTVRTYSGTARPAGVCLLCSCVLIVTHHFLSWPDGGGSKGGPSEVMQPRCGFRATSGCGLWWAIADRAACSAETA